MGKLEFCTPVQSAGPHSFHFLCTTWHSVKVSLTKRVRAPPLVCLTSLPYPSMYHLTACCALFILYTPIEKESLLSIVYLFFLTLSPITHFHILCHPLSTFYLVCETCVSWSINDIKNFIKW